MAHISTPGVGNFSELAMTSAAQTTEPEDQAGYVALTFADIGRVNTFPAIGTAANLTNLPQFGREQSIQVQGQVDAQTQEFTVNWTGVDQTAMQPMVRDGIDRAFRIRIANVKLPSVIDSATEHDDFYFVGQIVSYVVTPGITAGNTAVVTIASSTDTQGPYTTA